MPSVTKQSTNNAGNTGVSRPEPAPPLDAGPVQKAKPLDEPIHKARFDAVMAAAKRCGLLEQKTSRIGGRISPSLLAQAKQRTGIKTDTDLVEFALANLALADDFATVFARSRGEIDPDLKLGF